MIRLTSVEESIWSIQSRVDHLVVVGRWLTIVILLFGQPSWTLLAFEGPCPSNMTAIADLDMNRLLGKWYTYSMYPSLSLRVPKCQSTEFIRLLDERIAVKATQLSSRSGTLKERVDEIKSVEPTLGKFELVGNKEAFPEGIEIYVLDTDYENFAIRFMCIDSSNIFNFQWAVIQTRHRLPTPETVFTAQALARHSGIVLSKMIKVPQDACPPDS